MAGTTMNISIQMDADLKAQADTLFAKLGMNFSTAFDISLNQPNKETVAALLEDVIATLSMGEPLPEKNKDHNLSRNWAGHQECHILLDWILIYRMEDNILVLTLSRTGTHSDLFEK